MSEVKKKLDALLGRESDSNNDSDSNTNSSKDMAKEVVAYEVVRSGKQVNVPEGANLDDVIRSLQEKQREEEEFQELSMSLAGFFVFDALYGFHHVLNEMFAIVSKQKIPGFFGDTPPKIMNIKIDVDESVDVPIGQFSVPEIGKEGNFTTNFGRDGHGRVYLDVTAYVKGKYIPLVKQLFEAVRRYVENNSIYAGKAFRLSLTDDNGKAFSVPQIEFLNTNVNKEDLIFNEDVMAQINASLFTPITQSDRCVKHGIPLKRGVLLAGPYGVGKTLTSAVTAKLCTENNWTFILCSNPQEFADVLHIAYTLGNRSLVFCEDIDKILGGEERTDALNEILNILDGVQSKGVEVITVFTSNHPDFINPAAMRPGRIDNMVNIGTPDFDACMRLIKKAAGDAFDETDDYEVLRPYLVGMIPAVLQELVKRSMLYALANSSDDNFKIQASHIRVAAIQMKDQLNALQLKTPDTRSDVIKAAELRANAELEAARISAGMRTSSEVVVEEQEYSLKNV